MYHVSKGSGVGFMLLF